MSTLPHENVAMIKYVLKPKHELTMPNKKNFPIKMAVRFKQLSMMLLAILIVGTNTLFAQQLTVKGRVLSAAGTAVSDVSVLVRGTTTGTSTDADGNFSINVAQGGTLVFSAVNYSTKSVKVNSAADLTITLEAANQALDEVVVVGYGTQRKRDVTGAVSSVKETALREVPVANLQQALQGRAAGLEVQRTSNQPGGGAQIRIRGIRSINGSNDPLLVLDGIPYDGTLNDINPNDVTSVEILKDASATAIYGSRGANGVLLVTTKRGKAGDSRLTYNGYSGTGTVANPYPVFNSTEYQAMRNMSPWGQGYQPSEIKGIADGTETNWQDLIYGTSIRTDHNIAISGGSNGSNFMLGGGYYKETTVMPGEEFERYTLRAAIDAKVGQRIKVGLTTQNNVSVATGSQFVSGSAQFRLLAMSPLIAPYDSAGNINPTPWGNIDDINANGKYSPLYLKQGERNWVDRVRRLRTFNSLYGEYDIMKGLKYRVNLGLNYAQQHSAQFQPADLPNQPSFFRANQGNIASVNNGETWGYTLENILTYDKVYKEDHRFNFTGLYSYQEGQSFNNSVQKDSIADNFVQFYNLALSTPISSNNTALGGGEVKSSLISYMGRMNYSYKNKYLATVTYRRDGSSRLSAGNQYFDYWAGSLGWNISDEKFMQKLDFVDQLKLRVSYGTTSNQAVGEYSSLGLVGNQNFIGGNAGIIRYNFGSNIVSGYQLVNLPNPTLGWEFTNVLNLGLDFGFLNNRITGSIEAYSSKTDRLLYAINLPPTSGVPGAFLTNIGAMENKGMEFTVSTAIIEPKSRKGFSFSTDLNLFFNKNKLVRLNGNITQQPGNQLFVGNSMTSIWDYNKLGIWQLDEAAEAARFGSSPGQLKLEDRSGPNGVPDGRITVADKYVLGNQDAKLQGGLTLRFGYKGFDLSSVIYARFGGLLVSQVHQPFASFLTILDGRRNTLKVDYWTPTNSTNWFPQPAAQISPVSDAWSTLGYYSGTFAKLRSINLGYTFDQGIMSRIKAQSMRVYFTVDNVGILFSPYFRKTGIDPEGTGTGSQGVSNPGNIRGGQNGAITIGLGTPPRTTFTFGANITL